MPRNILSYYPSEKGVVYLDQTLPEKRRLSLVVREALLKKFINIPNIYSQYYGITLTFTRKWKELDPDYLHKLVKTHVCKSLLFKKTKYYLFPEFTEAGDLHYHGVIYDCYELPFFKIVAHWKRVYGWAKPEKKIRNWKNFSDYCYKHIDITGLSMIYKIR